MDLVELVVEGGVVEGGVVEGGVVEDGVVEGGVVEDGGVCLVCLHVDFFVFDHLEEDSGEVDHGGCDHGHGLAVMAHDSCRLVGLFDHDSSS